jgi:hypothetical protein
MTKYTEAKVNMEMIRGQIIHNMHAEQHSDLKPILISPREVHAETIPNHVQNYRGLSIYIYICIYIYASAHIYIYIYMVMVRVRNCSIT